MKKFITTTTLMLQALLAFSQFHTLTIPQQSNKVTEMQYLGVTKIEISYSSPSVNGRSIWEDPEVIPQKGQPIAWRAGANMNTTISFSTDVLIENIPIKAGTYGLHIIPDKNKFTLLFAHNNNQWGSYYLDLDNDITATIEVQGDECPFSEKLDFEFLDFQENSTVIGLEWANKRIPFTVAVDLDQTVVASLRSELRGINTYHWQAWNDAASWCLQHNTNLEEALTWVNRSINGGYGGFAADKNIQNLSTKIRLLHTMKKFEDRNAAMEEVSSLQLTQYEANVYTMLLLRIEAYEMAVLACEKYCKQYPSTWYLYLNNGIALHFTGKKTKALKMIDKSKIGAPDQFMNRLNEIYSEIENGTYQLPTVR